MSDFIMAASGVLFFFLFAFLMFTFIVYAVSLFVRRSFPAFQPAVSIVIPSYNEEKNIAACLDHVLASTYPNHKLEVIVVDDGSSDATLEVVKSYSSVICLSQQHKGKSAALTLGARAARHDFIITIDADTTVDKDCIGHLVRPLFNQRIGATTGVCSVLNRNSLLGMFQYIEYRYNDLIKSSFSIVFNSGIWFFGALAAYRKSALEKVGYFKADTLAEDMDVALELKLAGYDTYNVKDAFSRTIVPETFTAFFRQRQRWWLGVLHALVKNKKLLSLRSSPSILFLYLNQFWWSIYSFVSLPIIIYQVHYWLPYNSQSVANFSGYIFRWFTLAGPFYVIYKIPVWGISLYSIFGVIAGLISTVMIIASLRLFREAWHPLNLLAIFFYFPYTIWLNLVTFISCLSFKRLRSQSFIG